MPTPVETARKRTSARVLNVLIALLFAAHATRAAMRALTPPGPHRRPVSPLTVDLASDPAERLVWLPGIGAHKARAIVRDREENGPLESLEALDRVPGIGPETLRGIRDAREVRVVLRGSSVASPP